MGRMMCSRKAEPIKTQANNSAPNERSLVLFVQGCSQIKMPLTMTGGNTRSTDSRVTRRSKGVRFSFRGLKPDCPLGRGLEPILFHPPIQGAATEAQRLRCLTHVAVKSLQRLAN